MSSQKKNRFKPVFKQLIKLRENIVNRRKIFKFKKLKWENFQKNYSNKLRNFRKFKSLDNSRYFITKRATRNIGYSKRFRDTLHAGKRLRIFYGNLSKRYLKKIIKYALKKKITKSNTFTEISKTFIKTFENRLDTILYKAKFTSSIRNAQQLILHGKVFINGNQIKSKAYQLKNGDKINISLNCINLYENYLLNNLKTQKWKLPPKHLIINYKTLQIIVLNEPTTINIINEFQFNLRLQKLLVNYYRQ